MTRAIVLILVMVALAYLSGSATIINIPDDYLTIQEGINASTDGDTVLVQPGTYVENINFNGHNIVLGSLFLTTGDTAYIEETIIDGDSVGTVVVFESGEDSSAVITGFTIQNGFSVGGGGGVHCQDSNPVIRSNRVVANIACWGGGIACQGSNPIITDNHISENMASS
jgi:hypothetical protein